MKRVLFVTVGGSPAPIITSINAHLPEFTVFICSEDDPLTNRPGSHTQVTGVGSVCASRAGIPPDRPNIPTQLDLPAERFEVLLVPADDPSRAIAIIGARMGDLDPGDDLIVDYTGGTKSMTAALFYAAVRDPRATLSLVGGPRTNLVQVVDGTQNMVRLDVAGARLGWRVEEARRAWKRFAYGEAAHLLRAEHSSDLAVQRLLALSRGYAAWDAFDHARAYQHLQPFARDLPEGLLGKLSYLATPSGADPADAATRKRTRQADALRIWDLHLMSERRARAGRFDTAVLTIYRAVEWIAQWSLEHHHQIDAGNVPADLPALDGLGFKDPQGSR